MTYEPGVINAQSLEELRQGVSQELRRISDVLQAIDASGGQLYISGEISNVEAIQFDTSADPDEKTAGKIWYDGTHETLSFKTNLGNTIPIGEGIGDIGVNKTGGDANGKVVYMNGTQGHRPTFDFADAREGGKISQIGVCTTGNGDNEEDFVTVFGVVHDINTSSWAAGTKLYVAADATGVWTSTPPAAPNYRIWVATVIEQHATQGSVFVSPRLDYSNGVTLHELDIISSLAFASDGRIDWTKITANSVTVTAGTTSSTVSDLQSAHDGNIFHLDEAAATPGQDFYIEFINVTAFNWVRVLASYVGGSTHALGIQLYDWGSAVFRTFDCQANQVYDTTAGSEVICDHSFLVPDDSAYIGTGANEGKVRVRFVHPMAGNASHDTYIDEVALYQ